MKINQFEHIYFLGIGGIGMSAIARYFHFSGKKVSGYDRTATALTERLQAEGIRIHFTDLGETVLADLPPKDNVLIVTTPAVPNDLKELLCFKEQGYKILKRAEILGLITNSLKTLAVAGTHGKTTTSAMLAHVMMQTPEKCNAFLGGISSNYESNILVESESPWGVVEADEFDRSFLHLHPFASILTSMDADHLDVYSNPEALIVAFQEYVDLIPANGCLIVQKDIQVTTDANRFSYGVNCDGYEVDYRANNLRIEDNVFVMDVTTPKSDWKSVKLGIPGIHNAENALGVIALSEFIGLDENIIRKGLATFTGVKRRFEYHIRKPELIYIDDYAHHPTAIKSLFSSVKLLYPDLPIIAVFQPHLFSRTSDFMDEFATCLDAADQVYLLPIYPARERPIPGITSEALMHKMKLSNVEVIQPKDVVQKITGVEKGVVLTVGAGDIDRIIQPLKKALL
ncbi:MAG: UDP-N-acetylmuramate--L-alanine ligase [Brumimicrobium sp.]